MHLTAEGPTVWEPAAEPAPLAVITESKELDAEAPEIPVEKTGAISTDDVEVLRTLMQEAAAEEPRSRAFIWWPQCRPPRCGSTCRVRAVCRVSCCSWTSVRLTSMVCPQQCSRDSIPCFQYFVPPEEHRCDRLYRSALVYRLRTKVSVRSLLRKHLDSCRLLLVGIIGSLGGCRLLSLLGQGMQPSHRSS